MADDLKAPTAEEMERVKAYAERGIEAWGHDPDPPFRILTLRCFLALYARVTELEKSGKALEDLATQQQEDLDQLEEIKEQKVAAEARATTAEATLAEALRLLRLHHDHHPNRGNIGLPDGDGGWIEIDNGAEYSESGLYDMTEAALQGVPAPEIPVERGGQQNNWWQVGILERRKRKASEATLARYREALRAMMEPAHKDGCLWLSDKRMPCQCGAAERTNAAVALARSLLPSPAATTEVTMADDLTPEERARAALAPPEGKRHGG